MDRFLSQANSTNSLKSTVPVPSLSALRKAFLKPNPKFLENQQFSLKGPEGLLLFDQISLLFFVDLLNYCNVSFEGTLIVSLVVVFALVFGV